MKAFCSVLGPKDILWISAGQNWTQFVWLAHLVPRIKECELSWGGRMPVWSAEGRAGQIKGNWVSVVRPPRWHSGPDGKALECRKAMEVFLAMSAECSVWEESLRVAENGDLGLNPLLCWGRNGLVRVWQPTVAFIRIWFKKNAGSRRSHLMHE